MRVMVRVWFSVKGVDFRVRVRVRVRSRVRVMDSVRDRVRFKRIDCFRKGRKHGIYCSYDEKKTVAVHNCVFK